MDDYRDELARCSGFLWDSGNSEKNWERHRVTRAECEQVYFNRPLVVAPDVRHSRQEARLYSLGQTDSGRLLFVVSTIRGDLVHVISARDMSRRERRTYRNAQEEDPDAS